MVKLPEAAMTNKLQSLPEGLRLKADKIIAKKFSIKEQPKPVQQRMKAIAEILEVGSRETPYGFGRVIYVRSKCPHCHTQYEQQWHEGERFDTNRICMCNMEMIIDSGYVMYELRKQEDRRRFRGYW